MSQLPVWGIDVTPASLRAVLLSLDDDGKVRAEAWDVIDYAEDVGDLRGAGRYDALSRAGRYTPLLEASDAYLTWKGRVNEPIVRELTESERRQIEIERMQRVATARMNTLLRREPLAPLPSPPQGLPVSGTLPPVEELQGMAIARRPDLGALAARVRADEAAVTLATKQYNPDAEVFGRYDSFWQPAATQSDLRGQVGFNMNVPIYRQKLQAAVCEAQFRLSQRRAEYRQRQLDIQYEVQAAYEQVDESRRTGRPFDEVIHELETTNTSERAGRAMDHEREDAFERLRSTGYM